MKSVHPSSPAYQPGRHLEVLDEPVHDPQRDAERLASPAVCIECGAVCQEGRWSWTSAPSHALQMRCPACRRLADGHPAAQVLVEGRFSPGQFEAFADLAREVEQREKSLHPLRRLMGLEAGDESMEMRTTDVRLAHAIGEALRAAHQGRLNVYYDEESRMLRVRWTPEATASQAG